MGIVVLDTNVLVLAVGAPHQLKRPAQELLLAIAEGRLRATTTPEVVQEFAHVRGRRGPREEAAAQALDFATLLAPLIVTLPEDVPAALNLWQAHAGIGCFDSLLLAAATRVGVDAVVSSDGAFASQTAVPHLTIAQALATLA